MAFLDLSPVSLLQFEKVNLSEERRGFTRRGWFGALEEFFHPCPRVVVARRPLRPPLWPPTGGVVTPAAPPCFENQQQLSLRLCRQVACKRAAGV